MNEAAGKHIGSGIAWLGFWIMIGFINFGEGYSSTYDQDSEVMADNEKVEEAAHE